MRGCLPSFRNEIYGEEEREKNEQGEAAVGARLPVARLLARQRTTGHGAAGRARTVGRRLPLAGGQPRGRGENPGRGQTRGGANGTVARDPVVAVRGSRQRLKWEARPRADQSSILAPVGARAPLLQLVPMPLQAALSLAYSSASHFIPWRPKLICMRASGPCPSASTISPWPNFAWTTFWPMRQPIWVARGKALGIAASRAEASTGCGSGWLPRRGVSHFTRPAGISSKKREATL